MTKKSYDPIWESSAKSWLEKKEIPDELIEKYSSMLAEELSSVAEGYTLEYMANMERDHDEALFDAHIDQQIAERRGK